MEEKTVTLTLTPSEARRILRAVKARQNHWSSPKMYEEHEDAASIRNTYRDTADMIQNQMEAQGVKP